MKRLLLVLLVLGLSVPAIADVFVYNLKQSGVEFGYDEDKDAWAPKKSSYVSYVVIQVDISASDVNIWAIDTWKEKDTDEDDTPITVKYYTIDGPYTISFLQTTIAKKNTWIVEGISSDEYNTRIMVSGQEKLTKIGTENYTVAATLTGYAIYGDIESQDVGGGPLSLKLNSTITNKILVALASSDEIESAISYYFESEAGGSYEPY
jgi:hypothetical protein